MLLLAAVGCEKHKILYNTTSLADLNREAEFQLHYFVPMQDVSTNYIDSVFVNGELYTSVNGAGQLMSPNGLPVTRSRFYAIQPGEIHIEFMRNDETVYKGTATLPKGKSNVIVYDHEKDPLVIDNEFPYFQATRKLDLEHFNTDTVESLRLINLLFEEKGVPYPGKLQYQYRDYDTKDTIAWKADAKDPTKLVPITEYNTWKNVGEPVGFGETTKRVLVHVDKIKGINASGFNSSGTAYLYYRIILPGEYETVEGALDANGKPINLQVPKQLKGYWSKTATEMSNYSDYWTAYIGGVYNHFLCGIRTSKNDNAEETYGRVKSWCSL